MNGIWKPEKFEYVLALDSTFDYSELKYSPIGQGAWYYDPDTVIARLNEILGPNWDLEVSEPYLDETNRFLLVKVAITIHLPNGQQVTRATIAGDKYSKKYDSKTVDNVETLSKGSVSSALKKVASYFGVAYYLYNKDTISIIQKIYNWWDIKVASKDRNTKNPPLTVKPGKMQIANQQLIEQYDKDKMNELKDLFLDSHSEKEWIEYTNGVTFLNIKRFLLAHVTNKKLVLWKYIYGEKIVLNK